MKLFRILFSFTITTLAACIANHDHNQVAAGGANGAPEALWNNATKGPQIRGILDDGDVDLFIMTSLPQPSTATGFG